MQTSIKLQVRLANIWMQIDFQFSEKDILRLKINWFFVIIVRVVRLINYMCVAPTNHQFIINPTTETLNITAEVLYSLVRERWWITQGVDLCRCVQRGQWFYM